MKPFTKFIKYNDTFCKKQLAIMWKNKTIDEKIKWLLVIDQMLLVQIQAWWRGKLYRRNNLPNSILRAQQILQKTPFKCSEKMVDGRINSSFDEYTIIDILTKFMGDRISIPDKRWWFDVKIRDYQYGWLPINIKSSTLLTSDNTGNMVMCVYSITDHPINLDVNYNSGKMSDVLYNKIKSGKLNQDNKRDYYFVVINKNNTKEIIVNSVKGLTVLTPNINNLPYQIKWNKNKKFKYYPIENVKDKLVNALVSPKRSWKESFLENMRNITKC